VYQLIISGTLDYGIFDFLTHSECRSHKINFLPFFIICNMDIQIHRNADIRMSENLLQGLGPHTALNAPRRKRMSQM
jgi:hypothetical protein